MINYLCLKYNLLGDSIFENASKQVELLLKMGYQCILTQQDKDIIIEFSELKGDILPIFVDEETFSQLSSSEEDTIKDKEVLN